MAPLEAALGKVEAKVAVVVVTAVSGKAVAEGREMEVAMMGAAPRVVATEVVVMAGAAKARVTVDAKVVAKVEGYWVAILVVPLRPDVVEVAAPVV